MLLGAASGKFSIFPSDKGHMVMANDAKGKFAHISPASGQKASHVEYDSAISRQSLTRWCERNSDAQISQNASGYGRQIAEMQGKNTLVWTDPNNRMVILWDAERRRERFFHTLKPFNKSKPVRLVENIHSIIKTTKPKQRLISPGEKYASCLICWYLRVPTKWLWVF